jgi:DNA-binding NtrC family response regulator
VDETQTIGTLADEAETNDGSPCVIILTSPGREGRGTVWPLTESLVFGRTEAATAGLEDGRLSRRHAEISPKGDDWVIRDLKSRNGTSVGGTRLTKPHVLQPGDPVRLGATVWLFARLPPASVDGDLGMAGIGAATHSVRSQLKAVAPHPHTVLLLGETGSGKEVAARAVHHESRRRGPFVALNCGALAPSMLESELFGHKKGAFTGATSDHPGVFRAADGGTLFLDEIGEMPVELQTRLLRVLETRSVRPLGGTREIPADVRIVAATNRDPAERVRAGEMRADLYGRLAQWIVRLPALRDRPEDLPVLTSVLLKGLQAEDRRLSADLALALALHPWPLNVRGLRNVLSTACIASRGPVLELSEPVRNALDAAATLMGPPVPPSLEPATPPDADAVRLALETHRGSVASAARALGLSRQQLYRLATKLGVDVATYRSRE